MKKNTIPLLSLLTIVSGLLSLQSCHDKCEGSHSTSAEFKTWQELYYYDKENGKAIQKIKTVEEDTFMVNSYITFEAFDLFADSYEWTIGTDKQTRKNNKFTLFFKGEYLADQNPLLIKLKTTKAPNANCFPNDKGIDSVTHKIYFLHTKQWPVYGKYLGSDDSDPNTKYVIEIFSGYYPNGDFVQNALKNLPNNCTKRLSTVGGTAFEFGIGSSNLSSDVDPFSEANCFFREYDKHVGYLKPDRKTIVIDYQFTDKYQRDETLQHRIFTGVKQ